ncbi:MAG TPA: hypothetical protein VGX22_00585 [Candidatus Dormibacteraeota bacterium]|nr:hypothetical protein [Candidatus Dormibacteraeota bacterium]
MGAEQIGHDEARAALAKVNDQRAAVRAADLDRLGLLLLAAVNIGYGAVIVALAGHIVFPVPLLLIGLPAIPMAAFSWWRDRNERVFSRRGRPIWWASLAVYVIWLAALELLITPKIGWHPPTPDWHFEFVTVVGSIPLLIGAWLIGRVR